MTPIKFSDVNHDAQLELLYGEDGGDSLYLSQLDWDTAVACLVKVASVANIVSAEPHSSTAHQALRDALKAFDFGESP